MAKTVFPKVQNWKLVESEETFLAAGFAVGVAMPVRYLRFVIVNKGIAEGSFRAHIYQDAAYTKLVGSTNWLYVSAVRKFIRPGAFGSMWRGEWLFEFPRIWPNLETGKTYYMTIEAGAYAFNGTTAYIAFGVDGGNASLNVNNGAVPGLAFNMFGYKNVRISS